MVLPSCTPPDNALQETRNASRLLFQAWEKMLLNEKEALSSNLSELDISALCSWVEDCFYSFEEIYTEHLEKIKNAPPDNFDLMHDCIVDIFMHLDHIKNHIVDAENGFSALISLFARKAEVKAKEQGENGD